MQRCSDGTMSGKYPGNRHRFLLPTIRRQSAAYIHGYNRIQLRADD
jgi:hypothetical protein